ncbi:MAG: hypothetical protein NC126_11095 [Clostridium sp.]|nr:hypothetical protein [Clostridium sp.]
MEKRKYGRGMFARGAALVAAFSLVLSLSGCKTAGGQSASSGQAGAQTGAWEVNSGTGMGRYVEKCVFELAEGGRYDRSHFQMLADGKIALLNEALGTYVSKDGGESWQEETNGLLAEYFDSTKNYIIASGISEDGTVVLCYSPDSEEGLTPHFALIYSDGTSKTFDMGLSKEELYVRNFVFSESGRLFASVFGDTVYEIDPKTGDTKEFVKIPGSKTDLECCGQILICATGDEVYLYDMEQEQFIEDQVLQDFIENNYGMIEFNGGHYSAKIFSGEEGVLYVAGEKGLHRHVIGGSAMEQIIDGNLSSLGDPSHGVLDAVLTDKEEFLVQFSDLKTVKFTYDATISTVPGNRLTVYSLKENNTVRQAVSVYQTQNSDVYVDYEVGMEEGITREDAIKALNTKILEGSGPDVLVLDDMPVDSYIDKGILADLSGFTADWGGSGKLFDNLLKPFYRDQKLYQVPAEFMIPMISTDEKYLEGMDDYKGIADAVEALRKEYPGKGLMLDYSEKSVMKRFLPVCEPSWKTEGGKVDENQLREFLYQSKRIYDAVRDGMPEAMIDAYVERDSSEIEKGVIYEDSIYFYTINEAAYLMGQEKLVCGAATGLYDYANIISLPRTEGHENVAYKEMTGQSRNVYMPMTLAGINASSKNMDLAASFIQTLLSEDVQDLTHYGYPINRQSFENKFVVNPDWVSESGEFQYYTIGDADGNTIEYSSYLPDEKEMQMLRETIAEADTPYLPDSVLESAVFSEGAAYLKGEKDLDTAVKDIVAKVEIYLAE